MAGMLTFEDAEAFVNGRVMPAVSREVRSYLRGIGAEDRDVRQWTPQGRVRVRKLNSYSVNGREVKELGKYDPLLPGQVFVDPDALADGYTAAEVLTHEEAHKAQHFSGAIKRYAEALGEDARIFIEGGASAATEEILGRSSAYPAATELYRELEREVGSYDAFVGTGRAVRKAREVLERHRIELQDAA